MKSEIIDIKQASEYLGIKERTLYALAKNGKIPAIKIGGQWRFKRSQLDAMFEDFHFTKKRDLD